MYMLTIADQTRLFLLALGLGFLLGIVYDLFRVVRMAFTMRRVGVFIQDVLFFLTCAAATFLFLLAVNQGEIRGFIIAGEGLGFLIYYFSFGLLAVRVSSFLVHAIHRLFFVISVPFRALFRLLKKLFVKIGISAKKTSKKIAKKSKFNLKHHKTLLYNLRKNAGANRKQKKKQKRDEGEGSS